MYKYDGTLLLHHNQYVSWFDKRAKIIDIIKIPRKYGQNN